ncbi:MAG: endonuclease/exonuclease/phosphatase family protein [bacterium]
MRYFIFWITFLIVSSGVGCSQIIKIATYNIYFLDEGISEQRKIKLQKVIEELDADIIGFQEINNPAALRNILTENYDIAMIDDPNEVQEVALAVRAPFKIKSYSYVFPDSTYDDAFPRKRDLLQVIVEGYGREFVFLVHHAKSRRGGRMNTDRRREAASMLILDYIKSNLLEKNVILMGDFNDNPDDRSLNILEYGVKNATAGIDTIEDSFLFNTTEQLLENDICSFDYFLIYKDGVSERFNPVVRGSRAENNKWRAKEYNYYRDVKIKAILFDQILVSMNLKNNVLDAGVFNDSVAIKGELSKIKFIDDNLIYTNRGTLASDHVPVWTILKL